MAEVKSLAAEVKELKHEMGELVERMTVERMRGQWLTLKEACEVMHIGHTTMHARLAAGEYPWAVKKQGKWLFPANKVRDYVAGLA